MKADKSSIKFKKQQKGRVQFVTDSEYLRNLIKQQYTVVNKDSRFNKRSPKTLSAVSDLCGFKSGLTLDILKFLKKSPEWDGKFSVTPEVKKEIWPLSVDIKERIIQPENSDYIYRDYQEKAVRKSLYAGRGNIHSATASGKSLMIYGIIKNIIHYYDSSFKFLLLVPRPQLVQQFYDDINEYSDALNNNNPDVIPARFGSFADDTGNNENVLIVNYDWALRHGNEFPFKEDAVLVDEVHSLKKNNSITSFVNRRKTDIRFGFSGTLSENEDIDQLWEIKGIIGPEIFTKYPYELQNEGYIADVNIGILTFIHDKKQPMPSKEDIDEIYRMAEEDESIVPGQEIAKMMFPLEYQYVEGNTSVNNFMGRFIYNLKGNCIALFDHLEHIHMLYDIITDLNQFDEKEVYCIHGKTKYKEREDIKHRIDEIDNGILLAMSGCFKMGINIKNIRNLTFVNGYSKAVTKVIQSIGRGLRKSEKKDRVNIFDFHHSFKYSGNHFQERLKLYKEYFQKDKKDFKYRDIEVKNLK